MYAKNFFTYVVGIVLLTISNGANSYGVPHGVGQTVTFGPMTLEAKSESFDLWDLGEVDIAKYSPDQNINASKCVGRVLCIGDQYSLHPTTAGTTPAYSYAGVVWYAKQIELGEGQFAYLGLAYPNTRPSFTMLMARDDLKPVKYHIVGYGEMNAPDPLTLSNAINLSKSVVSDKYDQSSSGNYDCGFLQSCDYNFAFFMSNISPKPHLYIRLPRKFSADFGNVSFDVPLLDLKYKSANRDSYRTVSLNIKGTIALAQRCYAYIDGSDSNQQTIKFNDVKANAGNGAQEVKSLQLKSVCKYPPQDLLRTVKIVPISGATLSYDNKVLYFDPDESFQYTFGFIFRINGTPDCSGSSNDKYNYNVLSQYVDRKDDEVTWEDTLNIALCKYGIPTSPGGVRDVVINVQTEWRY